MPYSQCYISLSFQEFIVLIYFVTIIMWLRLYLLGKVSKNWGASRWHSTYVTGLSHMSVYVPDVVASDSSWFDANVCMFMILEEGITAQPSQKLISCFLSFSFWWAHVPIAKKKSCKKKKRILYWYLLVSHQCVFCKEILWSIINVFLMMFLIKLLPTNFSQVVIS